jgi:phosphoesterase RecJ-like protein
VRDAGRARPDRKEDAGRARPDRKEDAGRARPDRRTVGASDWQRVIEVLGGASSVALACHINPDGDALGSLLGATLGLAKLGKVTHASWGQAPAEVPATLGFLPGVDRLVQPADLPATDVFLALDCGAASRLGTLEAPARRARHLINIDHHPGNEDFGTLNVVTPDACCTAELVTLMLHDLGVALDRDIATCLYVGVVTDTGRFQYSNSSPEVLRLAADLLGHGVPATLVAREVFESSPFGYLKLSGRVLERARLHSGERFVYSWVTQSDLAETGVSMDETDNLVDLVRSTRDADVAALFKQQHNGGFRVSLRSKARAIASIARAHGGGGHELAAGFTATDMDAAVDAILRSLRTSADGAPASVVGE